MTPPLDLRTSPVLRRTSNAGSVDATAGLTPVTNCAPCSVAVDKSKGLENVLHQSSVNIQISLHQSASITSSIGKLSTCSMTNSGNSSSSAYELNTVYETCRYLEEQVEISQTPKTTGVLKRNPSFAERNKLDEPSDQNSGSGSDNDEENDDVWYTPNVDKPRTKSLCDIRPNNIQSRQLEHRKLSLRESYVTQPSSALPVSKPVENSGRLWSFVSSVLHFAKLGSISKPVATKTESPTRKISPLIKRWASFAGMRAAHLQFKCIYTYLKYRLIIGFFQERLFIKQSVTLNRHTNDVVRVPSMSPLDRPRMQINGQNEYRDECQLSECEKLNNFKF